MLYISNLIVFFFGSFIFYLGQLTDAHSRVIAFLVFFFSFMPFSVTIMTPYSRCVCIFNKS